MNVQNPQPGSWKLFRIWASIGLQSFGGGTSTAFLIQRAFIEKYNWMTAEEFTHFWGLCILTPGMNLTALTILIGKKLGGVPGVLASLAGLLLPSAAITCVLAAIFVQIEHIQAVQAIMKGMVAATGGIMLLVGLNFALPLMRKSSKEGMLSLLTNSVLIISCALAVIFLKITAMVVVLGAIVVGAILFSPKPDSSLSQNERENQQ